MARYQRARGPGPDGPPRDDRGPRTAVSRRSQSDLLNQRVGVVPRGQDPEPVPETDPIAPDAPQEGLACRRLAPRWCTRTREPAPPGADAVVTVGYKKA